MARIAFEVATALKPAPEGVSMAGYRTTLHKILQASDGVLQSADPVQTVDTTDPFGQISGVAQGQYLVRVVGLSADGGEVGESVSEPVLVGGDGGNPTTPTMFAFPSGLSLTVLPD